MAFDANPLVCLPQGIPYTPYAPAGVGVSVPLPLPPSPTVLHQAVDPKLTTRRGPPGAPGTLQKPRSPVRATSVVAEYIRRNLCDPHTPRGLRAAAPTGDISRFATPGTASRSTTPLPSSLKARPATAYAAQRQHRLHPRPLQRTSLTAASRTAASGFSPKRGADDSAKKTPRTSTGRASAPDAPVVKALTEALTRNQHELEKLNASLREKLSVRERPVCGRQKGGASQGETKPRRPSPATRRARSEETPGSRAAAHGLRVTSVRWMPGAALSSGAKSLAKPKSSASLRTTPKGAFPRLLGSEEITEAERARFLLALEEVEREFGERIEDCASVLPSELSRGLIRLARDVWQRAESGLKAVQMMKLSPKERDELRQFKAHKKREAHLQAALTEARANVEASRDHVSRLRRLLLPLQHSVAAYASIQRANVVAQGTPYVPYSPAVPAIGASVDALYKGEPRGVQLFDAPENEGGPLNPSLSDPYSPRPSPRSAGPQGGTFVGPSTGRRPIGGPPADYERRSRDRPETFARPSVSPQSLSRAADKYEEPPEQHWADSLATFPHDRSPSSPSFNRNGNACGKGPVDELCLPERGERSKDPSAFASPRGDGSSLAASGEL
ncbi:uncharacterized protein LOC113146694 [Cyclospora cayetanensis]|uniref:Uncharacterized protein LOC113146694 n=1 Tax=Cyclospora cayetanensis TaxID=88456 RepID=A0A6P6RS41_9EIME|nr:uncharacterized protein LOC113146694 [Cyclospora cayetanensis]